jgi:hypothetical protein
MTGMMEGAVGQFVRDGRNAGEMAGSSVRNRSQPVAVSTRRGPVDVVRQQ